MQLLTVNDILSSISSLSTEEQSLITDILLNKRMRDLKQHQLQMRGQQAQDNYNKGTVVSGTVADLMSAIDDD